MKKVHRITIQVTLDVEEEDDKIAISKAVARVRAAVGDDGVSSDRKMWVTGIAQSHGDYMIYPRFEPDDSSVDSTVAESQ